METKDPLTIPEEIKQQIKLLDRPMFVKFLSDGKTMVWRRDGKLVMAPLTMDIPAEDILMSKDAHLMLRAIYEMTRQVRTMKRAVPLTRTELFDQLPRVLDPKSSNYKTSLRELIKKDIITEDLVPIERKGCPGKEVRVLILFTSLGRGYIKKYVDDTYTLEGIDYGTTEQPKADNQGGEPKAVEGGDNGDSKTDSPPVQPTVH